LNTANSGMETIKWKICSIVKVEDEDKTQVLKL